MKVDISKVDRVIIEDESGVIMSFNLSEAKYMNHKIIGNTLILRREP